MHHCRCLSASVPRWKFGPSPIWGSARHHTRGHAGLCDPAAAFQAAPAMPVTPSVGASGRGRGRSLSGRAMEDGHANRTTLAELERAHRGAYVMATLRAALARPEGAARLGLDHQPTE